MAGRTLYVLHETWLQAIDVSSPRLPREVGLIRAADLGNENGLADMALDAAPIARAEAGTAAPGDILYIAGWGSGIAIVEAARNDGAPMPGPCPGCRLWLPAVSTGPAGPVAAERYLLVERWWNDERGPRCPMLFVDFPTYSFDPTFGVLNIWSWLYPRLAADDVGYYASGSSVTGAGSGAGSRLTRIEALPFTEGDLEIRSVAAKGVVEVVRAGETITVPSGREQRWQSVRTDDTPGCVITTTERITNLGYQYRAKITYR